MTLNRSPTLKLITNAFLTDAWALTPTMFERVHEIILERGRGERPDLAELQARIDGQTYGADPQAETQNGDVRVVSLHGVLISRAGMMDMISGATTPQMFATLVRAAADDPAVSTIVLDVDSPGGTVSGTQLAAEAVSYAQTKKPVIACINDMACSAALWIASQAGEIVIPSSGTIGSIGVIGTHVDRSKALAQAGLKHTVIRSTPGKALGQPSEPMTGAALEQTQARLDALHAEFVQAVATGRGVPLKTAQAWGTGDTWLGAEAVRIGLADRLGSISEVLAELTAPSEDAPDDASFTYVPAAAKAETQPTATEPPPEAEPIAPDAAASEEELTMNIQTITAKLQKGETLTAEESTFLATHLSGLEQPGAAAAATQATPVPAAQAQPAAAAPDTSAWPPEARAAFEGLSGRVTAAEGRAQSAEQAAAAERDIRLTGHFEAKARDLGQPVAFAATLRAAHDKLTKDEYEAYENALKVGAQAASGLMHERGSATAQASGDVSGELTTRAKALMAADTRLTLVDAQKQVMAADSAFAHRYHAALRN